MEDNSNVVEIDSDLYDNLIQSRLVYYLKD
jgi:hypothetical protein